ncbi:MAG: CCA tRNA nucleotidyltransferase [Saprospiraceae bacterium]
MIFKITEKERELLNLIGGTADEMNAAAFAIGGYVRDKILDRNCKDIDIVCIGSGIGLAEAVANKLSPRPKVSIFQRFGTAMFRYGEWEVEFVGARKESYRADSRKPSVENGTLEDDQNRRDFTINAMAIGLNAHNFGTILDPFNGMKHLEEKIIKTPLEPDKTFSDDPLRMMRAIRFASQLHFRIDNETLQSISENRERINIISKERITIELEKIMAAQKPSVGFKLLFDTGLLKIIFPEVAALQGVEIKQGKAHKDNFYHTLEVLDNVAKCSKNIWLRWAALLHDIAKPPTKRFEKDHGWTFHGHETLGAAMVPRIFVKLKLPQDSKMKYVQKLVLLHLRPIALTKEEITDSAIRRLLFDAGEDIDDLMILAQCDITSKKEEKVERYLANYEIVKQKLIEIEEKDHIRTWQPPITGEIIMKTFNIPPSRPVGEVKEYVKNAILDGLITNDYKEAFELMLSKGKEIGLTIN